jgi:hypothetical protein
LTQDEINNALYEDENAGAMVINPRSAVTLEPKEFVGTFERLYRGLPFKRMEKQGDPRFDGGDRTVPEYRPKDMTREELNDMNVLMALEQRMPRRDLAIPQEGYVDEGYVGLLKDPYMVGSEEIRPDQKAFDSRRAILRDDRMQGPEVPVEVRPRPRLSKEDIRLLLASQERG